MRHGAHKASQSSNKTIRTSRTLFAASHGSHRATAVAMMQTADGGAALLGIDQALADKLNEVAPQTRRAMRQAARAAERRSHIIASASLAALVGTAASTIALANPADTSRPLAQDPSTTTTQLQRVNTNVASRSESRTPLSELSSTVASDSGEADASQSGSGAADSSNASAASGQATDQTTNEGDWQLGDAGSTLNVNNVSRSNAHNPNVATLMDQDAGVVPDGFDPNHVTGENGGNAYPYGQCTWWVYQRRTEMGLPVGSYFGNGNMWADSARNLGYWVDNTPRHVGDMVVFQGGQFNADTTYGHVAIIEKINADGSIEISESNAKGLGVISSRTFSAADASQLQFVHY